MRYAVVAVGMSLALLPGAGAQEAGPGELERALVRGADAPQPGLTRRALERAEVQLEQEVVDPACGRRRRWLLRRAGRPWLWVDQDQDGAICHYAVAGEALIVARWLPDGSPRPAEAVRAEVEARTRFSAPELERRARRFLRRLEPSRDPRPLALVQLRRAQANPVTVRLTFVQRPRPGVLACYPNVYSVSLNPETGEVAWFSGSWVEAQQRTPAPVDGARARRLAGRVARVEGPPRLSFLLDGGAPRLVWIVPAEPAAVVIDARTGARRPGAER